VFRVTIDSSALQRDFSALSRKWLRYAINSALNETAWQTRMAWRDEMPRVFDRPTRMTLNAVLYNKATTARPYAEVFIRDEAFKGTPPATYLLATVMGGQRGQKPYERLLRHKAGILGASEYTVPGRRAPLNAFGNLPSSMIGTMLSDLGARRDPQQNSTQESRRKRQRRRAIAKRSVYFYSHGPEEDRGDGRPQHLPRGIYRRTPTAFGSALDKVLQIANATHYRQTYPVFDLAEKIFHARFQANLNKWLDWAEKAGQGQAGT
jgi:hypothetical protein